MNEGVHFYGCSVYVEVEYIHDIVLVHEWLCVCFGGFVEHESYNFFMCAV